VLVQTGFESFQAFEKGAYYKPDAQWGLLPILSRDAEFLWKRCRIKHVAHDAISSGLVSASVSQIGERVSRKMTKRTDQIQQPPWSHTLQRQSIPVFAAEIPRLKSFEKAATDGVPVYVVSGDRRAKRAWAAYESAGKEIMYGRE
jgi:hypothetical protein